MIDSSEWEQIKVAIELMASPMSVGRRETCFKDSVLNFLATYKVEDEK